MAQSAPQEFLFPREVVRRRLDSFDVEEAQAPPSKSVEQRAVSRLIAGGLAAEVVSATPLHILGGRCKRDAGGIAVYDDGFMVTQHGGSYKAIVSGPGSFGERILANSVDEAIDFVIDEYRRRAARVR